LGVIHDPQRRGHALAEFFLSVEPRLYADLVESGVLPARDDSTPAEHARREWECFALYACVRGLVAAGGFNRETAAAIDALHERVLSAWSGNAAPLGAADARSDRIAERYAEYGGIGQAGGASGAGTVTKRLGEAAARHITLSDSPPAELAEWVGTLHETLAEGAAEAVRQAE
jgi:hypothetical protein